MKIDELVSKQPGSHKYKRANYGLPDFPNHLVREFEVNNIDHRWCSIITYVWAGNRWAYLAVVIDLSTRKVVGSALSKHPDSKLLVKALDMAYQNRGEAKT